MNETFKDKALFGDECEVRLCDIGILIDAQFRIDAKDPQKTAFQQFAFFQLPRFPMAKSIEKFMCKNYEKHTGQGRQMDIAFVKDALASGSWQALRDRGQEGLLNMPIERSSTTSVPVIPEQPFAVRHQ